MFSSEEIRNALQVNSAVSLEQLAQQAYQLTRQRFGHAIQLYAPLYLSNECVDTCSYCGFSRPNQIERTTLTVDQATKEANYLTQQGFTHLLLVAGEHPKAVSVDYLTKVAQKLKPHLASLSIEVAPFEKGDYQQLTQAGIDGVVIYQETYDRQRYDDVHLAGPKRDYDARIEAPERAIQGGARRIGMGVLLGLADWRVDAVALTDHVRQLQAEYPHVDFQISLPRLRDCAGGLTDPVILSDEEFVRLICVLRLALPEVGIVLSTRERPELRDGLVKLGVTQMSAGSKTNPGGYEIASEAEIQFEIVDERSPAEVAVAITEQNLQPVWKDWESILYG